MFAFIRIPDILNYRITDIQIYSLLRNILLTGESIVIVTLKSRSIITIPANVRKKLSLKDGDSLDVDINNGSIVLTPVAIVPRKTTLTASGMKKEKTADSQIKKGRTKAFLTAKDLIEDLHENR